MENGKRKAEDEAESAPAAQRSRGGPKYPKTMVQRFRSMIRALVFCFEAHNCLVPDVIKIVVDELRACYGGLDFANVLRVSAPTQEYFLRQFETLIKIGTTPTDTVVSDFLTGRELCHVPTESMTQVIQCAFTPSHGYILIDIGYGARQVYDMEVLNSTDLRSMHLSRVPSLAKAPCPDCVLFNHGETVFFVSLYQGKIRIVDLRTSEEVAKFRFSGQNVQVRRVNSLDPNLIVSESKKGERNGAADAVRFSIDADRNFTMFDKCEPLSSLPQERSFVSFFDRTHVCSNERIGLNRSRIAACLLSFDQEQKVRLLDGLKSIDLMKDWVSGGVKASRGWAGLVWDGEKMVVVRQ